MANKANLPVAALVWTTILFLVAVLITFVIFLSVVGPENRTSSFYIWLSIVCAAEFIIFAWTGSWAVERSSGRRISGGARVTIHVMIAIWLIITFIVAFTVTAAPEGRYQDYVALVYLALTFLFLLGSSTLYGRDLSMRDEQVATQYERARLRSRNFEVDRVRQALRDIASANPEQATRIDRISKRLEGISTSLDYSPPAKAGTWEEEGARSANQITSLIIDRLDALYNDLRAAETGNPDISGLLSTIESKETEIESLLAQRQRHLLT